MKLLAGRRLGHVRVQKGSGILLQLAEHNSFVLKRIIDLFLVLSTNYHGLLGILQRGVCRALVRNSGCRHVLGCSLP